MSSKPLHFILLFLTALFSFMSWLAVDRAINITDSSVWLVPIGWFSLFFIALGLSFVLIKEEKLLTIVIILSLSLSLLFSFDYSRVLFFLLAILLILVAQRKIKRDLELNIKVDVGKSVGIGKSLIVISLVLIIVSQYYSEIKSWNSPGRQKTSENNDRLLYLKFRQKHRTLFLLPSVFVH